MNEKRWKGLCYSCVTIVLCFFVSCVGGNYGSIIPDTAVAKSFESLQMDPDMNYYYSGSDVYPNAVIGLKKKYVFNANVWKPIEPQLKVFKELIGGMQTKALRYQTYQHGFIIKDDKGEPIGVWYSILKARTFVKVGEDNKVTIAAPDLMIFEEKDTFYSPESTK